MKFILLLKVMRTRLRICHEKQSNIIHESTPQITFEPCGRVSSTHIEILILLSLVILFIARLTPKRKQEKTIFNLFFPSFFFEEKSEIQFSFVFFFSFSFARKSSIFEFLKTGLGALRPTRLKQLNDAREKLPFRQRATSSFSMEVFESQ